MHIRGMRRLILRRETASAALRVAVLVLATLVTSCGRTGLPVDSATPAIGTSGAKGNAKGTCEPGLDCVDGVCVEQPDMTPSCAPGGPGLTNCGDGHESCCTSLRVEGGTFYRTYVSSGASATGRGRSDDDQHLSNGQVGISSRATGSRAHGDLSLRRSHMTGMSVTLS